MCRNIKTLFNFEPPATGDEIRASAVQFVRKLSGFTHPSQTNRAAFDHAVDEVEKAARKLLTRSRRTRRPATARPRPRRPRNAATPADGARFCSGRGRLLRPKPAS